MNSMTLKVELSRDVEVFGEDDSSRVEARPPLNSGGPQFFGKNGKPKKSLIVRFREISRDEFETPTGRGNQENSLRRPKSAHVDSCLCIPCRKRKKLLSAKLPPLYYHAKVKLPQAVCEAAGLIYTPRPEESNLLYTCNMMKRHEFQVCGHSSPIRAKTNSTSPFKPKYYKRHS